MFRAAVIARAAAVDAEGFADKGTETVRRRQKAGFLGRLLNYPVLFAHLVDKSVSSFVFAAKDKSAQPEFWIAAAQVAKPAKSTFYPKLEETLESFGFAVKVRSLCAPAY